MVVSPDGSGKASDPIQTRLGFEFKCPMQGKLFTTPVHYKVPHYYIPQLFSEMKALNVSELLYVCYSPETSTVFHVTFDAQLWEDLWKEILCIYSGETPMRPKCKQKNVPYLKDQIKIFMEKNIKYLGEFKSVQGTSCSHQLLSDDIYRGHKQQNKGTTTMLIQDDKELPLRLNKYIEEAYNILRTKASEILCFLLSDLDRMYKPELPHSIPVAYGLEGYSLKSEAMRSMMETILSECKKEVFTYLFAVWMDRGIAWLYGTKKTNL